MITEPWEDRHSVDMFYLGLNIHTSVFSAPWPVVGPCNHRHLRQKETSLVRTETH